MKKFKITVTTEDNIYNCEVIASSARPAVGRGMERAYELLGKKRTFSPVSGTVEWELLGRVDDAEAPTDAQS